MKRDLASTRYVSIAAAGTSGNAYVGVLDALETHLVDVDEWRRNLKGVVGCSAGCLMALTLLLGINRTTRDEMFDALDLKRLVPVPDVALLVREYGVDDGTRLVELVQELLLKGGLSSTSTLGDVKRLLRMDFVCTCTDLGNPHDSLVYLSSSHTPDVRVCDAVAASCAAPLVFSPRTVCEKTLVDGVLAKALPTPFPEEETLFIAPEPIRFFQGRPRSWKDFVARLLAVGIGHQCPDEHSVLLRNTSIVVRFSMDRHTMDDTLTHAQRMMFRQCGYVSTVDALKSGSLVREICRVVAIYAALRHAPVTADANECPPPNAASSSAFAPAETAPEPTTV